MKLASPIFLTLSCGAFMDAVAADKTKYVADLGDYGFFNLTVDEGGESTYEYDMFYLNSLLEADSAAYHLHSGPLGGGNMNAGGAFSEFCGGDFTKGHYDPTLKCGKASTAPLCADVEDGTPCCETKPTEGYCTGDLAETCEIGDLSGLNGRIPYDSAGDATGSGSFSCPDCNIQFLGATDKEVGDYATWASVVFHDSKDGGAPRVLCANFVKEGANESSASTSSIIMAAGLAAATAFVAIL